MEEYNLLINQKHHNEMILKYFYDISFDFFLNNLENPENIKDRIENEFKLAFNLIQTINKKVEEAYNDAEELADSIERQNESLNSKKFIKSFSKDKFILFSENKKWYIYLSNDYSSRFGRIEVEGFSNDTYNETSIGKIQLSLNKNGQFSMRVSKDGRSHISAKGEPMRSKAEVIIANLLYRHNINYEYERNLYLDGQKFSPDFTIILDDNKDSKDKKIYWEHCGMLEREDYRKRLTNKINVYRKNGISIEKKNLILTRDYSDGGIDSKLIEKIIKIRLIKGGDERKQY